MNMSFWSQCQGLILRLKYGRAHSRPRLRHRAMASFETLERRTLLSSTPVMVADINPGSSSSNAADLVAIGSTTYFSSNDGVHGAELWKSDGTAAGTTMVTDINPGPAGSSPGQLTNVNGTLFFSASDGADGIELWRSDGTAASTVMVKDTDTGNPISNPGSLTNVNGTLFFSAYETTTGQELWRSDGTAAGTTLVADIDTGVSYGDYGVPYGIGSNPTNLTNVNGTLFFEANNGGWSELWKSDGTAAGTARVSDIALSPGNLTNVNGTLFFTGNDGINGVELWKSDGTTAGTTIVKDIFPGTSKVYYYYGGYGFSPNSSSPGDLTNSNGTLFFSAYDGTDGEELWKSDGTAGGTVMVKDIDPGSGSSSSYDLDLTNVNGTLFFQATDGTDGVELWKTDGTAAGTVMVKDIFAGNSGSYPSYLTNSNGTLFFSAYEGTDGRQLWKSDGTSAGTTLVADINPGSAFNYLGNLTNVNGTLLFTVNDGIHGNELWALNTTPAPSLTVTGFPTTTTAGVAGTSTITVENADGTTNTGYRGTVRFSTSDPQATIIDPATGHAVALQGFTYTFTAGDAGVHNFSATLKTAGYEMIAVADTQTQALNGAESSILVNPAAASTMTVGGFPSTTTAGMAQNVTVTLKDPYGNVATGYTGTLHFTSSDAKATLPVNYVFTAADAGTHTFSVTLKTAGTRSITAADTVVRAFTATETGITVNAAAATEFLITAPSTVNARSPFNLTLTVEDAYGNVVTNYTGTVHFTSTDQTATLPANYTFTSADKGVHSFTGLVLRKREKQKITIGDTRNGALTATLTMNVH